MEKNSKETFMNGDHFFRILKSLVDVNQTVKVDFRGKRYKDQWFPTIIHWITDAVEQRNKDEKEFPREHRRGETDLQEEFVSVAQENQKHIEPAASTHGPPPAPQPLCSECGNEREPPMAWPNDPIERIHIVFSSPIKRTHIIRNSLAYNDEQVFLGEYEGQRTSMHTIANIAL
ncbi:hypothetical protein Cgig2_023555 [Carnegiea gigantea]|uniref:Uncharacterized protein n=1 Tax=Carnegiea gigantea TaxID=171969 RepID=A0A9Q1JY80_9CARY|nr:hypothetical protein Cgig2_023555 [Carnegiea gigantea]